MLKLSAKDLFVLLGLIHDRTGYLIDSDRKGRNQKTVLMLLAIADKLTAELRPRINELNSESNASSDDSGRS